ncbi:unnamed protein product [Chilo suppressalis]|uniref:Zinc transporter ZIP11 n=1 Tax=Chilo suppressalis TaxID=168631 RepID=A0ABN8AWA0_CHISP|nr:unnamed protein product [Chilo suppressalis]
MITGYGPVTQALLGTLLTWGLTAAGAGCVFFIRGKHRKLLDVSLGFAAGVMTAASYWSLLKPAIEMCEESDLYGANGQFAFVPIAAGFLFGAVFVFGTDRFLDYLGINSTNMMMSMTKTKESKEKMEDLEMMTALNRRPSTSVVTVDQPPATDFADCISNQHTAQRRRGHHHSLHSLSQWKRIMLLVVAITVHNIPEGLAVGVSFGAASKNDAANFNSARYVMPSWDSITKALEARQSQWKRIMLLVVAITVYNIPGGLAVDVSFGAASKNDATKFNSARYVMPSWDSITKALHARQSQWKRIMLLVVAITVAQHPRGTRGGRVFQGRV